MRANHVCLGALVVANMGQECAVHVRSCHDRHNAQHQSASQLAFIGVTELLFINARD